MLLVLAVAFGAGLMFWATHRREPRPPDPPAVVERIRDVARLETLDVTLYKKVSFEPDAQPTGSLVGDAFNWAKFTLRPPKGKAIVFAVAHVGLDLSKLGPANVWVDGSRVKVKLPPLSTQIELRPGETEVVGSNLDSQQTAQLFEVARAAFEQETEHDARLQERARGSAERAVRGVLVTLGFREVKFVDAMPTMN